MNRPLRGIGICLGIVALVTGISMLITKSISNPYQANGQNQSTTTPSPMPLDPRSIQAVRKHAIAKSQIIAVGSLPNRGGCNVAVISYQSDGNTVRALMQLPVSAQPAAGYPVVILAHGYIAPTTYQTEGTDYQSFINYYCAHGYAVIKPDYRGNGQSTGIATGGDLEPDYTYDILNLVASLPNIPKIDSANVALLGHSMGAAVILRVAVAAHGLPIRGYIFASGVVGSLIDIAYDWPDTMIPADIRGQRTKLIEVKGTPAQNPNFWHDTSSINYVAAISGTIQIDHGDSDTVVPLLFSQHLDHALTEANKPHEFNIIAGADHQYSPSSTRAVFLQKSLIFLDMTLK